MKLKKLVVLTATASLAFVACTGTGGSPAASQSSGSSASTEKVAILLPGLITDGSWNEQGYNGLQKAKSEGATTAYTESVTQDQQVEDFRNYASQGFTRIIGHGGEYMDSALQVAKQYPNIQFVVINGDKSATNVTSLTLSYGDMGYLAGVEACAMTKSKMVGMVIGQQIPIANDSLKGFKDGCARVDPSVQVKDAVTGDFADVGKANEAALALIAAGCDVLFHNLDAADAGVFAAAQDKGVYAIGLYSDESSLGPKASIGAALSDVAPVVYAAASGPLDGKVHEEGAKEGAVSFGAYSSAVPQSVRDTVTAALNDLKSGKVTF